MAKRILPPQLFDPKELEKKQRKHKKYGNYLPTTMADRAAYAERSKSARRRKWTDEQLSDAVRASKSIAQTLRLVGLVGAGGNYRSIWSHIKSLGLDTSHFLGQGWNKGGVLPSKKKPLSEVLVENSNFHVSHLRKRLVAEGILEPKCGICGIMEWCGAPLSLHLDHRNGINTDHRIENLRLLCPNCHSQTPTYAGNKHRLRPRSPMVETAHLKSA